MSALDLLRDPFWQRLALALLHFVWQGALIALVLGGSMWLLRVRRPQVRYVVWLGGLALMAVCPAVTFVMTTPAVPHAIPAESATGNVMPLPWPEAAEELPAALPRPDATAGFREWAVQIVAQREWLVTLIAPYLVLFWFAGVGLFGGRLLLGFAGVHWLALGRQPPGAALAEQAAVLARRIGLRRVPRVAICTRAREALAIGFVRPLIVLPAAWLTELPPEVLRAVLAHELAHIRRRDVWVNLLQRVIETLLFYHPAVWWVSRRARAERELCCDDLAVRATGERIEYAQALECVAQRRLAESSPLLAAGIGGRKMALLKRVRHVLGTEPDGAAPAGRWSAGLVALAVPPALWLAVSVLAPPVVGQEEQESRERERSDSPEARERERDAPSDRREGDRTDRERWGFGPEFQEFQEAQRQAREAQERAEDARRRAEDMMRQMMQRRMQRLRPEDQPSENEARERDTGRPGPEEFRERMERFRRERAEQFSPGGPPFPGLIEEIRRLREEVQQLRREVEEMRQGPRGGGFGGRGGAFRGEGDPFGSAPGMPGARSPFGRRLPSPPGPPDQPRIERDRDRGEEQELDRERRDADRRKETRGREGDERRDGENRDELPMNEERKADEARARALEGTVLSKKEDPAGRSLLEISLGSDDGLGVGHDLQIYRDRNGRTLLGRAHIVYLTPDRSVGMVTKQHGDGRIEKGDAATTMLAEPDAERERPVPAERPSDDHQVE